MELCCVCDHFDLCKSLKTLKKHDDRLYLIITFFIIFIELCSESLFEVRFTAKHTEIFMFCTFSFLLLGSVGSPIPTIGCTICRTLHSTNSTSSAPLLIRTHTYTWSRCSTSTRLPPLSPLSDVLLFEFQAAARFSGHQLYPCLFTLGTLMCSPAAQLPIQI